MAKEMIMAGCAAAAHAAKFARVEGISSYPIRPYTGIMTETSKLGANRGPRAGFRLRAHGRHERTGPGMDHGLGGDAPGNLRQHHHLLPDRRGSEGDAPPVLLPGRLLRFPHSRQGDLSGAVPGGRVPSAL